MTRISDFLLIGLRLATALAPPHVTDVVNLPIFAVSSEAWQSLNASIDGRLKDGRPATLPCFSTYASPSGLVSNEPDWEQCREIVDSLTNSDSLIREFGSYHNPTFATCMSHDEKCTIGVSDFPGLTNDTCYQGTVPDYYVDAHEVRDIQRSLEFARTYKIPITVKNTGHDYKGRSAGPNTLAIWTHHLTPELDINKNFAPEKCENSAGPVVTYGAGQTSRALYEALDGTGYFALGGSCTTVGVSGGWVAGGGHSILTPILGLGVDNAIQMRVVLPNGTYVTANRCQNQELFFALRGGGGGTYGVVTETTSRLHEDREFTFAFLTMDVPADPRDINVIIVANAERWADEGWGGLYGVDVGSATTWLGFNPNLSVEEAELSLKPVTDYFESLAWAAPYVVNITTLPNHWAAQNTPELLGFLASEAGISLTRSSRLVPRENFKTEESQEQLVDVLVQRPWSAVLGTPTAFQLPASDMPGGPGESSVTPAWRDAVWHFSYTVAWDPADPIATAPDTLFKMFDDISRDMDLIRAITPNAGAYMNEGDVYEPHPIESFWGRKNYDRLLKLKQELDPENLMSCYTCVGWDRTQSRYRCYLPVRPEDDVLMRSIL